MNDLKLLSDINSDFSNAYLKARKLEGRVYEDSFVRLLPDIPVYHDQYEEWQLRKKTADRFIDYIKTKSVTRILDIGCGNGWFTNLIAKSNYARVYGVGVNLHELEQAERVFKKENLQFGYADIFDDFTAKKYDVIVLNNSIHYFSDLHKTIERLKELLAPYGEIHILDTPIYSSEKRAKEAEERTNKYYKELGCPEMIGKYFHHSNEHLNGFETLYNPNTKAILNKLTGKKDSPFKWIYFKAES